MVWFDPWVHKKIAEAFELPWEREPPRPYEEWIEEEKRRMKEELGITPGEPTLRELATQLRTQMNELIGAYRAIGLNRMAQLAQEALSHMERAEARTQRAIGMLEAVQAGIQAGLAAPVTPVTPPLFEIPEIKIPNWLKWVGIGLIALIILGLIGKVLK